MRTKHLQFVFWALFIVGCHSFPTNDQKERYTAIQKNFNIPCGPMDSIFSKGDSSSILFNDAKILSPEDFIAKHQIKEKELDPVLLSLEVTVNIRKAFLDMDKALKESQSTFEKAFQKAQPTGADSKIEPLTYAKENYLKTGDSMSLKVKIAGYDSTPVMPIKK